MRAKVKVEDEDVNAFQDFPTWLVTVQMRKLPIRERVSSLLLHCTDDMLPDRVDVSLCRYR